MKKLKIGKKSGLRYFGYEDIKSWKPCYDPIKHIPSTWRGTALDILDLSEVSFVDRLWVVLRPEICSEKLMRLAAVWCARQCQHLLTDPRSIKAIDVAEAFANGLATKDELYAACADAYSAANSAANSAYSASAAAAYSAANSAANSAYSASAAYCAATYAAAATDADIADASTYSSAAYSSTAPTRYINKLKEMILAEAKERKGRK